MNLLFVSQMSTSVELYRFPIFTSRMVFGLNSEVLEAQVINWYLLFVASCFQWILRAAQSILRFVLSARSRLASLIDFPWAFVRSYFRQLTCTFWQRAFLFLRLTRKAKTCCTLQAPCTCACCSLQYHWAYGHIWPSAYQCADRAGSYHS